MTPQGISKAIANLGKGYERYNGEYGYTVKLNKTSGVVIVNNRHYGESNELANDLKQAGYYVMWHDPYEVYVMGRLGGQ